MDNLDDLLICSIFYIILNLDKNRKIKSPYDAIQKLNKNVNSEDVIILANIILNKVI